ncbi:TBC1 domain family member 2B [Armadillidium nasatum]|uniref:TBC1 domain family member 2B n=1 Tax=Armadillidium nasatum TaxID=96803 RepID=A0A5N5SY61_9CRUS|nr:TBC1 domain family member 2B [Armadillidium nasatum]
MEDLNNSGEGVEPEKSLKNEKSSKEFSKQYSIHGYLMKHNDKIFVKGLKSPGTVARKRWFVYSDATCKLYYYKSEKDPEPLGEIDIAIASLSYNVENSNNSLFTISSNGKDYTLEASSPQMRLYWLQQLQTARREFNERISLGNFKSGVTCIGRPESGLLQDCDPLPEPSPDPNHELNAIMSKSMDSAPKPESFIVPNVTCESEPASPRAPRSPILSPTSNNNFDKFSNRLRTSFRIRKPKFGKFTTDSPEEECKKCIQAQEELKLANERVSQLTDRCDAHKEAIILLQKDLESLQKGKITLEKLINHSVTDDDILTIFREKDRKIVELEHLLHQLKNSLASLTSDLRDSRIHNEHLQEKLDILTSLVESKDNAIVELSRDLEGCRNSSSHLQTKSGSSSSTFYSTSPVHSYPQTGTISICTQTSNVEYEDLLDKLDGYKCQNTFLNKEILDLNHIFRHRNEREQKLIAESSTWEAKFYQIQSKYLLLLNDLHSPQSTQHDSTVLSQLLQDIVESQGTADLRVVKRQGKGYNEYGFCVSVPETDILSKAEFLQKQSKANAWLAQQQKFSGISVNYESQWESFLAVNNAKELPQHPDLKYLIRDGIPYQYKGKVWRLLIEHNIGKYKASLSPTYYQDLLSRRNTTSTLDPAAKQIELDLLRTLPNNRHYESPYSDGIPKLRRVLLAV